MSNHTSLGHSKLKRVARQMIELGHPQIRNGNEVGCRSKASGDTLGLLQQTVHGPST